MKAAFIACCASIAIGAACAASDADRESTPSDPDGSAVTPDAAPREEREAGRDSSTGTICSDAGWCRTALPDQDLVLKDIWPVGDRAFAIADSATLGVKILEWNPIESKWSYIDDGTQNEVGFGKYAGRLWAPNEAELYYGVAPGWVYYGRRPTPPATAWTWTRQKLEDHSHAGFVDPKDGYPNYWRTGTNYPALGIWGTSGDDVHAWFTNTIYRRTVVDGATVWVAEHIADDAASSAEHVFFLSAAGTGPDDVWFSGARSRSSAACALLVHKTPAGYQRIADGSLTSSSSPCVAKDGQLLVGGSQGWLIDIHTQAGGLVGLKGGRDVVRISPSGDGFVSSAFTVPTRTTQNPLHSLWADSEALWLSGRGIVLRADEAIWDGGAWQISTTTLGGAPVNQPLYQIRGTSNTNLWAIGVRHALHKATP